MVEGSHCDKDLDIHELYKGDVAELGFVPKNKSIYATLSEFRDNAQFIRITSASRAEGEPHGLVER